MFSFFKKNKNILNLLLKIIAALFTDEEAQFCNILPNGGIKVHLRENMKIYTSSTKFWINGLQNFTNIILKLNLISTFQNFELC